MNVPEILFQINMWNLLLSIITLLIKGKGLGCPTSASSNIRSCCQCSLHRLLPSSQLSLSSRSTSPERHPHPMSSPGLLVHRRRGSVSEQRLGGRSTL